jgi:plasmid stabilization system protein ParE
VDLKRHPDAQRELDEGIAWYEDDYPGRGRRFLDAVHAMAKQVLATPHRFTAWRRGSDVRVAVVERFPYSLFFRIEETSIVVYAVAHHKRRPGYWRKRLGKG